jgi:hypothetical protein
MEEETFAPEESLKIIQTMISRAKNSVADNSFYFLLWGWIVFVACIGQFVLKVAFLSPYHPLVWTLTIVGVGVSIYRGFKQRRMRRVRSYVDENLDYLWRAILGCYFLVGFAFYRIGWEHCFTFYMLLYALGTFVSGMVIKFPPLVWGAVGCWFLAFVTVFVSFDVNILLCALAILISYIVPGYMLRARFKRAHA